MHKKTKLICIGILATAIVTISIYNFDFFKRTPLKEHKVKLVIDAENKNTLPPKFRTTSDTISLHKKGSLNLSGLSDLNASGSGAFSEDELKSIKNKIGNKPIVDIDLRQESHIFVNGIGISWYGKNDDANLNLTSSEVLKDENNKLMRISKDKKVTFDKLSKKKSISNISQLNDVKSVETEEQLAKALGINYSRITVPDHKTPDDAQINSFVSFVKNLPKGTWLHFHCRGGKGRTTTFMAMYDMMINSKKVSFYDIMKRQKLIGGADLLSGQDSLGKSDAEKRVQLLKKFYNYCQNNNDNFKTSWTNYNNKYRIKNLQR